MQEIATTRITNEFLALCGMGLGLVAILGVIITSVTVVIAVYKRRTQLDDMEATIKMEMIERGMSAEDIERVLRAKMGSTSGRSLAQVFDAVAQSRQSKKSPGQTVEQA